jgi:hypothetical protein
MFSAGGPPLICPWDVNGEARVRNWWRRWSYEIPLAISDALWDVLVVQFAALLDRLTLRRVLEFVAIAVLVMAFAQTFPIDLAILFAGDTLMYLEIVVAIRLAAGRAQIIAMVRQIARLALGLSHAAMRHPASRLGRWRERRRASRITRPTIPGRSDDDPAPAWGMLATA